MPTHALICGDMVPSVLILTRNEEKNIRQCLEAVYSQDGYSASEVIVIDSGSTDRTVEIATSYPARVVQIQSHEFHHGKTRNLAASLASGDCLVYLSADAFPVDRFWLRAMLWNFEDPSVGAVYGRQVAKSDATPERRFFMENRYGTERIIKRDQSETNGRHRHCQFSDVNSAIRREVWAKTRFPEDLNAYEDFVIAQRILREGFSIVYEPAAAVYHSHNYTLFYSLKQYFDTGVVYQRLGVWDSKQKGNLRSEGIRFLFDEMRFLISHGTAHRCPYVVCYEAARYLGIVLGRNNRVVPRFLKRHLSSHHLFGQ